jgi:hypothetical protein
LTLASQSIHEAQEIASLRNTEHKAKKGFGRGDFLWRALF